MPDEVLDAAWRLRDGLDEIDTLTTRFLCDLADWTATSWREPDGGLWEARDALRHYMPFKVVCWVALDRAAKLADRLGAERDAVHATVLAEG